MGNWFRIQGVVLAVYGLPVIGVALGFRSDARPALDVLGGRRRLHVLVVAIRFGTLLAVSGIVALATGLRMPEAVMMVALVAWLVAILCSWLIEALAARSRRPGVRRQRDGEGGQDDGPAADREFAKLPRGPGGPLLGAGARALPTPERARLVGATHAVG